MQNIIGEGGFGVVIANRKYSGVVHKLLKNHIGCADAYREFSNHQHIYKTYQRFIKKYPRFATQVRIPKPIRYLTCNNVCTPSKNSCLYPCSKMYHCAYSMERIPTTRKDGIAEHVMLNEDDFGFGGHVVFVHGKRLPNSTYVNSSLKQQGPRGAFLSLDQLVHRKLDPYQLAYRMGILFELIRKAGCQPKDVEYLLGPGGCLYVADFGMVHETYTNDDMEYDMYVPQPYGDLKILREFESGRQFVKNSRF